MYKGILDTPINELKHHGVKGMKWGQSKSSVSRSNRTAAKKAYKKVEKDGVKASKDVSNSFTDLYRSSSKISKTSSKYDIQKEKNARGKGNVNKTAKTKTKLDSYAKHYDKAISNYNTANNRLDKLVTKAANMPISIKKTPKRTAVKEALSQYVSGGRITNTLHKDTFRENVDRRQKMNRSK